MGGMLLHLQRRPATPLVAAERCTNSTDTLAALRAKARANPPDPRPAFLRWILPPAPANSSDYRTLEDSLEWGDVEQLCLDSVGEHVYRQLQHGSEPFGMPSCCRRHAARKQVTLIFPRACASCVCAPEHSAQCGRTARRQGCAGIAPMVNPASSLYNDEAYRTKHLIFDPADPQATNPSGLPYAFRPLPIAGFPLGYALWFDMGLPQSITQHRLQYLKDGGFFSARRAATATLQFAGIDVQRSTVVLVRVQLQWDDGGTILGTTTIVGMPLTTTATSPWVRHDLDDALAHRHSSPWLALV